MLRCFYTWSYGGVFVGKTTISFFEFFKIFSIPIILQTMHLAFTLYAMIYARKFDIQKIPFTKRLGRYIASFLIGIGLLILSFVVMFIIGYCVVLLEIEKRTLVSLVLYITFLALSVLIILSLLSYILYKNHKPFFTKIFDRILSMVGKRKS